MRIGSFIVIMRSMPGHRDSEHYHTLKAKSPNGDSMWDVHISFKRLEFVSKKSKGAVLEAAHVVPEVLENPSAIFEGLRRDEDEDEHGNGWMCYCGLPTTAYNKNGTPINPWPDEVFMVFLNADCVAYHWYWHKRDRTLPDHPDGHETRFRRRVWP